MRLGGCLYNRSSAVFRMAKCVVYGEVAYLRHAVERGWLSPGTLPLRSAYRVT